MKRKGFFKSLLSLVLVVVIAGACSAPRESQMASEDSDFVIIPYVFGSRTDISKLPAEKLTHVNYAFAHVNDQGEIYFRNQIAPMHIAQSQALKAKNPDFKIIVSVGGWGADGFSDAVLTEAAREKFALSAVKMIKDYGLDGLDLDWEFPGFPGGGIKARPEDTKNFTDALRIMRGHIDRLSDERGRTGKDRYLLTIATTDGQFGETTENDKIHPYLDWVNIMTYDFYGRGPTTGHHTGLHKSDAASQDTRYASKSIQYYIDAGIPPHKLVVGAGFYGEMWTGVNAVQNGVNQPYGRYVGSRRYNVLVDQYINKRGFTRHWDAAAQASYLWNPDSTTWIGYDDPQSLQAKAAFVKERGLRGIMWWEQGGDHNHELLSTVYDALYE